MNEFTHTAVYCFEEERNCTRVQIQLSHNPNEPHQGGKRFRFNQTKHGCCEPALISCFGIKNSQCAVQLVQLQMGIYHIYMRN